MRAQQCLHFLCNLLCIVSIIADTNAVTEESQWDGSSSSFDISTGATVTNVSSTTRPDAATWNAQEESVGEKTTNSPTSSLNSLIEDPTTERTTLGESTESLKEFSTLDANGLNEENHISGFDVPDIQHFGELYADNTIDTSDDLLANLNTNFLRGDLDEDPECQSVEQFSTSHVSDFPLINANSILNDLYTADTTTDQTNDEGEWHVEDPRADETYQPDSLTVSWKRPNTTLRGFSYRVQWSLDGKLSACKVSEDADQHAIILTGLKSCRNYGITVTPYTREKNGTRRDFIGTTGLNVSNGTLSLNIANKTTDSLTISWSMEGIDCVRHYSVDVCHDDTCEPGDNATSTTYTKPGLNPCWNYFFNLTVYGPRGPYKGSVGVNDTTDFLTPGQPPAPVIVSGNRSLSVDWEEPIGSTCVDHYRVTWIRNDKIVTKNVTETLIVLRNLEPCAVYEIGITAVWDAGESEEQRVTSTATAPDVTDPPVAVSGPTVEKDSISIEWRIRTNETNNCVPVRLLVTCNVSKTLGHGYPSFSGTNDIHIDANTENVVQNLTVFGLSAYTIYVCHSATLNTGGRSPDRSLPVIATTLQDVPSAPKLRPPSEIVVTNSSIALKWNKPAYIPGELKSYMISIIWNYILHRPPWCVGPTNGFENKTLEDGDATSYLLEAMPGTDYLISIFAATEAGYGNADNPGSPNNKYTTKAGAPSEVTNVTFTMKENAVDPTIMDVSIMWGAPCLINSDVIEYYRILATGNRPGYEEHNLNFTVFHTASSCVNDTCYITINNMREEHTYNLQIATKVSGYDYLGNVSDLTIHFPAGIPPSPDANYTSLISIDPLKARRTTTTATILLPIFPDTKGTIQCYAIIVSKCGYNNGTFGRFRDNSSRPYVATWSESKSEHFAIPYQAVQFCADCYFSYVADYGSIKAVKFVLGEDTVTCPEISSNQDNRSYCNGPLDPDTCYHVRMRAFTAYGYRDSIFFQVKTDAELQVGLVIGTIFGILFLGILTTMMLLVRKCSLQVVLRRFLHSDMTGSPVPAPFTRRKFIAHCQQLADNPGKLSNEYQLLQTLSVDLQMPTNAACLQANRKKNRYTDILPYDFSRVKLEVIDNDPNTDYINASIIKGFSGEEDYIACQGPKEETTYDFWRMIDQYKVKIIVMLTQLVEKNKEKCHQYFPTIRETFTYENMSIRCTSELDYKTYTQRTLVLQKENEKRTIIHLHFKDWPDHDVPEDFDPMINFCQIMRRHMGATRGLVVVHCSAGIGRTGTLIAIDILLQHIKENRKLDVFGTVYRLRHHRINMVQRESQYAYIYNCIKQVLKNPYFSKTYKPPSVDPIFDGNSHKKKETSDSNTNLVSSLETLEKNSFSTSEESADPRYQTSTELAARTCYPFYGLRWTKSTSAIDTRAYPKLVGRSNTHDHPICDISNDAPELKNSDISDISFDITESEGSTTSLYENMQPLLRSKSAHAFGRDDDSCVIQSLLEHDTPL